MVILVSLEVALHHRRPALISVLLLQLQRFRGSQTPQQHELLCSRETLQLEPRVEGPDVDLEVVDDQEDVNGEEDDGNHQGDHPSSSEVAKVFWMFPTTNILNLIFPNPEHYR